MTSYASERHGVHVKEIDHRSSLSLCLCLHATVVFMKDDSASYSKANSETTIGQQRVNLR